jgi:aminomethyltransferase
MADEPLKRTPLHDEHEKAGARLVPFAGYEMPVQYEGVKAEHEAVRQRAGLFDVSHMGEVVFRGPDAERAVQRLVPATSSPGDRAGRLRRRLLRGRRHGGRRARLQEPGRLPRRGQRGEPREGRRPLQGAHAGPRRRGRDESDDWALLALQGPEAVGILGNFTDADLSGLKYYRYVVGEVDGFYAVISRTGYTGEDGFELYVRPDDAAPLWRRLVEAGATPAGLGARDTLRLEAGMCLYGNELDPETTPLEAGIGFAVHLDKAEEFVGRRRCAGRRRRGSARSSSASRCRGAASRATTTRWPWAARPSARSPAGRNPRRSARP